MTHFGDVVKILQGIKLTQEEYNIALTHCRRVVLRGQVFHSFMTDHRNTLEYFCIWAQTPPSETYWRVLAMKAVTGRR